MLLKPKGDNDPDVRRELDKIYQEHGNIRRVLDVGSYAATPYVVKEEVLRWENPPEEVIGVDMRSGPNVDVVLNAHYLSLRWPDPYFDLITCYAMLEHDDKFWISVDEMKRILSPNGVLSIAVPAFPFPLHNFPSDYWRFSRAAVQSLLSNMRNVRIRVTKNKNQEMIFGRGRR